MEPLQLKEDIIRMPVLISIQGGRDLRENVLSAFRNGRSIPPRIDLPDQGRGHPFI